MVDRWPNLLQVKSSSVERAMDALWLDSNRIGSHQGVMFVVPGVLSFQVVVSQSRNNGDLYTKSLLCAYYYFLGLRDDRRSLALLRAKDRGRCESCREQRELPCFSLPRSFSVSRPLLVER